ENTYFKEWATEEKGYISPWGKDKEGNFRYEPKHNYPISPKENFKRVFSGQKPVYIPLLSDMTAFSPGILPDHRVRAWALEMDSSLPGDPNCKGGEDMFGVFWEYVPVTGGSMVRPGEPKIPDITRWEEYITFPDISLWDWEGSAQRNKAITETDRPLRIWLMNGLNERLISLMDFKNVMIAYVDEEQKEGVKRFYNALCDFYDELIYRYRKYYGADVLMFNDDWGTQKGPQFSPDTAREMLVPYMRRIVESCHKNDMHFELHCCGKNEKLTEVIVEAGVDIWLPQEDLNDMEAIFNASKDSGMYMLLPSGTNPDMSDEQVYEAAEIFMEKYGYTGHIGVGGTFKPSHKNFEKYLYALSREYFAR
ncbi:MAG: hypothetical protein GX061_08710, partial [Eubacteriaceae bacterium]|nr:hypothetical protein [Eubacteriaceae bacterium]